MHRGQAESPPKRALMIFVIELVASLGKASAAPAKPRACGRECVASQWRSGSPKYVVRRVYTCALAC